MAADKVDIHDSKHFLPRLAQDEFRFFMDDAGSKLLVLPTRGNAAAEGAAAELGTPTATFSVASSGGASSRVWVGVWTQDPGHALGFDLGFGRGSAQCCRALRGCRAGHPHRHLIRYLFRRRQTESEPCVLPRGWSRERPQQVVAFACPVARQRCVAVLLMRR